LSATEHGCFDPTLAFARKHDLAGHLAREDVALRIVNKSAAEAAAGLLALGFQAGFEACQREDGERG
jgi:hypothetical protein